MPDPLLGLGAGEAVLRVLVVPLLPIPVQPSVLDLGLAKVDFGNFSC